MHYTPCSRTSAFLAGRVANADEVVYPLLDQHAHALCEQDVDSHVMHCDSLTLTAGAYLFRPQRAQGQVSSTFRMFGEICTLLCLSHPRSPLAGFLPTLRFP